MSDFQNFVLCKCLTGTNKHDLELDINQLTYDDSYVIEDPKDLIAYDIFRALSNFLDVKYREDMIRQLLDKDGKYKLNVCDFSDSYVIECVMLTVNNKEQKYYYDVRGEFISRQIYTVTQILEHNVVYLVTDHVINPKDDCPLIERCYHPYFEDEYEALRYCRAQMSKYENNRGAGNSGYRISVADVNKLNNSQWYQLNIKAASDIVSYDLDPEDYRYVEDINEVVKMIQADAYFDLPFAQQVALNREIFDLIQEFIPDYYLPDIEEELETNSDDQIRETVDYAMTVALANIEDAASFRKFHECLGPNEYRIGNLTDDLYNAHPNEGYIVVSKEGLFGWYESCYAINNWEESRTCEFHGVFQPNEDNTLLSFREFHPEMYPNILPKKADIDFWDSKYKETMAVKKHKHDECRIIKNDKGEPVVKGTWWCEGLESDESCPIYFLKKYGSHEFDDEEIKRLLDGEEIVVENFITKMDFEVTIRGKLQDVSSPMDEQMEIRFVRTDIDTNERQKINQDLSIDEPGLPKASD